MVSITWWLNLKKSIKQRRIRRFSRRSGVIITSIKEDLWILMETIRCLRWCHHQRFIRKIEMLGNLLHQAKTCWCLTLTSLLVLKLLKRKISLKCKVIKAKLSRKQGRKVVIQSLETGSVKETWIVALTQTVDLWSKINSIKLSLKSQMWNKSLGYPTQTLKAWLPAIFNLEISMKFLKSNFNLTETLAKEGWLRN